MVVEGGEVGVRRQAVLAAEAVQGFSDEVGAGETTSCDDDDGRMRDRQPLRGDGGPEVHLVADEHVRTPPLAQLEHRGGAGAGEPAGERLAGHLLLVGHVDRLQRPPVRGGVWTGPGEREPRPPHGRAEGLRAGDVHLVTGGSSRPAEAQQWPKVTLPADEAAQQTHQSSPSPPVGATRPRGSAVPRTAPD